MIQNNNLIALLFLGPEKIQQLYPRTVLRKYRDSSVRQCRQYKQTPQEQQPHAAMLLSKMWSNNYCLGQKMSHLWKELQPLDPSSRSVLAKVYYLTKTASNHEENPEPKRQNRTSSVSNRAELQYPGISCRLLYDKRCQVKMQHSWRSPNKETNAQPEWGGNVSCNYQEVLRGHPGH